MDGRPTGGNAVVFQKAAAERQMFGFEDELHRHSQLRLPGNHEANGIARALFWQARAGECVSQIAGFEVVIGQHCELMSLDGTRSAPCRTERHTRRVGEGDVVRKFGRREKRAGQGSLRFALDDCIRGRNRSQGQCSRWKQLQIPPRLKPVRNRPGFNPLRCFHGSDRFSHRNPRARP
jgi:hypothetical protein